MVKLILSIIFISINFLYAFNSSEELSGSKALITQSARARACGSASSSLTKDLSLLSETPTAICGLKNYNFYIQHMNFILDMYSETINFSRSFGTFSTAISLNYFDYGKIPLNDAFGRNDINATYQAFDFTGALTLAYSWTQNIHSAASFKYLQNEIWYFKSYGFAVDFASVYNTPFKNLTISMVLKNLGFTSSFLDTTDTFFDLLPRYKLGASYTHDLKNNNTLNFLIDLNITEDDSSIISFPLGLEYNFKNLFSLRAGYHLFDDAESFSCGFRLAYLNYSFDYSYSIYKEDLGERSNPHLFGISINF